MRYAALCLILSGLANLGSADIIANVVQELKTKNEGAVKNKAEWLIGGGIIPQVVAGGPNWQTTIIFMSTSPGHNDKFYLRFYDNNGSPMTVPINGQEVSEVLISVPASQRVTVETDYAPNRHTSEGFAKIEDPYDCSGCQFDRTNVTTIYRMFNIATRQLLCEATSINEDGSSDVVIFPFDNDRGFVNGFAYVNTSTYSNATVVLLAGDEQGNVLGQAEIRVNSMTHRADLLTNLIPQVAGKRGILFVLADQYYGMAYMMLRFSPNGTFTLMPPTASLDY